MQIIVNGKPAYIKKGSSFQFVAENRHFTGSDSYSLSITFPLKGCSENIAIFGNIHRTDVEKKQVNFECTISDKAFSRSGIITVTSISESEVKTQFLEGRSVQNYDVTFDEIFINELDLGSFSPDINDTPSMYWRGIDRDQNYIALPWVNNSSGNVQNEITKPSTDAEWQWGSDVKGLSFQPYLLYIIGLICRDVQYSVDLKEIENSPYKYLIICNALPYAWDNFYWESILPHWSLTEFFEQIGYLLGGDFIIDHKARHIKFEFAKNDIASLAPATIDKVVDSYTADVAKDNDCTYFEQVNMQFADCDHQAWQAYSCDWFIKENSRNIMEFPDMGELDYYFHTYIEDVDGRGFLWYEHESCINRVNKIFYVKDVNTYFVLRCYYCRKMTGDFVWWKQLYHLMPVNSFGPRIINKDENAKMIELKCVPVWIDNLAGNNWCIYLDVPEFEEKEATEEDYQHTNDNNGWNASGQQLSVVNTLLQGEKEGRTEFYDKLFLGFWDGHILNPYIYPFPIIDTVTTIGEQRYYEKNMSLRLKDKGKFEEDSVKYEIDTSVKYSFSFLADEVPNPRTLFYIKGQRYLCEKITATFTENGMSQLLKGVFYKVK